MNLYRGFSGVPAGAALLFATACFAQAFKVGDAVEASPLAISSRWEQCVVTQVLPGGSYAVACGAQRTEYAVPGKWVRAGSPAAIARPSVPARPPAPAPTARAGATPPANGDGACRLGARVTDRSNRSGSVVQANGPDCRVKLDDGTTRYYLAWMLTAEGSRGAAGIAGALEPGRYDCWAAAGVAGTMKLEIKSGSSYAGNGKAGTYGYDPQTQKISFQSGPWAGFFGARLGAGKIGISSRPGGFYNTTCDLK